MPTLRSYQTLRVVDLIGEGPNGGLIDGAKSVFFDGVVLQNADNSYNFEGVTVSERLGWPTTAANYATDQAPLPGISGVEAEIGVTTEVTHVGGGISRVISNAAVDDVRVTLSLPALQFVDEDDGKIRDAAVSVTITVATAGGVPTIAKVVEFRGRTSSEYRRAVRVTNLAQYGAAPWTVTATRDTADSGNTYLQNRTYWASYTEIINQRLTYPDSFVIGVTADSRQFGNRIPARAYEIRGRQITVPGNYNAATRSYSGTWDGTFTTAVTDNPAWIYYDLVNNSRYGLRLEAARLPKWTLYTIARFCDAVDGSGAFVGVDDGNGGKEPRFAINTVINRAQDAYQVVAMLASSFNAMAYWATGAALISQDAPADPTRLVSPVNVIDGMFVYSGVSKTVRKSVAIVYWNDPANLYRLTPEVYEDPELVRRYGWNEIEVTAFGATSRGIAQRLARWTLASAGETVSYSAGWDHADCLPGEIIRVADPERSLVRMSGRLAAATTTALTLDAAVTLETGATYTAVVSLPDGSLEERAVTTAAGVRTVLALGSALSATPQAHAVWMLVASNLAPRHYRVLTRAEPEPGIFAITAAYHDPNKYAAIEEGIIFDPVPDTTVPTGALAPPTALAYEEYTYVDGQNNLFGVLLSWVHSLDARVALYEVELQEVDVGPWRPAGTTADNSLDVRPLTGGTYNFRVRSTAPGVPPSVWATYSAMGILADPDALTAVANLRLVGGGIVFTGRDAEFMWDTQASPRLADYVIEMRRADTDALLRTDQVSTSTPYYTYDYGKNWTDTAGTPVRAFKIVVYARDVYAKLSAPSSLSVSNPAPTMAGLVPTVTTMTRGLHIDWRMITPADNDLEGFVVYCSTTQSDVSGMAAGALIAAVGAGERQYYAMELEPGDTYYVLILPRDGFGDGIPSSLNAEEPLEISSEFVLEELALSITITDSDGNSYP